MDASPTSAESRSTDPELDAQILTSARALPARYYVDPDSHALDRRAIFARSWHLAGHVAQFAHAGDHQYIEIADVPLIVLRDADGALRALHNVCRHRAGPLAICGDAHRRRLRCRYHGWSYGLDGRLLSAPEMQRATGFDPDTVRLPSARVECWRGLVFVALEEGLAPQSERLAALDRRLATGAIDRFRFHRQIRYDIACNWKIYVDNYLEGYHIPHIHPELNRMLDYRSYLTEAGPWHSLQHSPLESDGDLYGSGDALYVFLWPNAMLNLLPDRLQINRVRPLAADRCQVEFDYFYPEGDSAAIAERHSRDHVFSDLVQHEDVDICEAVQRGLASRSYTPGRLNPQREAGVHHFQELLRAAYRAAL